MTEFEFIRPLVLWLLLPVFIIIAMLFRARARTDSRQPLIAAHLARFVMPEQGTQARSPLWLSALFLTLAVIAAAGPSWQKNQLPVYQAKIARVIVMDMSLSMLSTDIKPDRLTQARFKTLDMIEQFKEGDTGLVAYAGDAYTISPLTGDVATLENLIPSLGPDIMPEKGSNLLAGLLRAEDLLRQGGYLRGDIVIVTDGIDGEDMDDLNAFAGKTPYRLNVYGIGTEQGAPISLPEGGFLKDSLGQIVVPKTNYTRLQTLAQRGRGQFSRYTPDNRDISHFKPENNTRDVKQNKAQQTLWRVDGGIYFLILLLPMTLWLMRDPKVLGVLAFVSLLPWQNAQAADWQSWFRNDAQNALKAYQGKEYNKAKGSDNAQLKGAASYQLKDYQSAIDAFSGDPSALGRYNLGNALAKNGELEKAAEAYRDALSQNPDFSEAKDNLALVEKLQQQQQQQQQQQSEQEQDGQSKQDKNDQNQPSDKPQGGEQNGKEQQGESQSGENQDGQSQQGEKQGEKDPSAEQNADAGQNNNQPEPEVTENQQQAGAARQGEEQGAEDDSKTEQQRAGEAQKAESESNPEGEQASVADVRPLTQEEQEKAQQLHQLMRKIPDDPAILLRNKMILESQKRRQQRLPQGVQKSW